MRPPSLLVRERERERESGRKREREKEWEREGEREREREYLFLKGMMGALAPFSYLVTNFFYYFIISKVGHNCCIFTKN